MFALYRIRFLILSMVVAARRPYKSEANSAGKFGLADVILPSKVSRLELS